MAKFSDIRKIAGRIGDKKLRKRVIETLQNPGKLSSSDFSAFNACSFEEAPASINFHHIYVGGLLDHTYAITKMSLKVAGVLEEIYNTKIDYDSLIAASLLHDVGKLWCMKKEKGLWESAGLLLDHTMLWTSELYARNFPNSVIHIVASHFGENGPTPPGTIEAIIFHLVDNFDAKMGTVDQESLIQQLISQMNQ